MLGVASGTDEIVTDTDVNHPIGVAADFASALDDANLDEVFRRIGELDLASDLTT